MRAEPYFEIIKQRFGFFLSDRNSIFGRETPCLFLNGIELCDAFDSFFASALAAANGASIGGQGSTASCIVAAGKGALLGSVSSAALGKGLAAASRGSSAGSKALQQAASDAFQRGKRTGAAAELRVGNRRFIGISGESVAPHPKVTAALIGTPTRSRKPWHGGCGEIVCLDKAFNAGVDPRGGTIVTVNIGASGKGHLTRKGACTSCQDVLGFFGVRF